MQNLIVDEIEVSEKPEYYSVSRLKSLSVCSEYYKLKYIDKIKVPSLSGATIIGSLCHDALEYFHSDENLSFISLIEVFKFTSKKTLVERNIIHKNIPSEQLDAIHTELWECALDNLSLYARASQVYKGPAPIRKKDGGIASNPTSTTGWKKAEEVLRLLSRKGTIDAEALRLNPELGEISLAGVFAEAFSICYRYHVPEEVVETIAVEFPISEYSADTGFLINPVPMPEEFGGEENIYLNGFIDWIGRVYYRGAEKLAIVDYKSSKEDMAADQVQYNVQLYSYVYAYEFLTGETVDLIGIHNLRSGRLVLVEVDREIMQTVLGSLFFKHNLIKAGMFYKHAPDSGYSPCLSQFGKPCPYLANCYPKLYEKLNPTPTNTDPTIVELAKELDIKITV